MYHAIQTSQVINLNVTERDRRLAEKLKRELGEAVLSLLADERVEDILLNPDSSLWTKRLGEGFTCVGQMPPTQALCAMGTIAAWHETVLNHDRPVLETELPLDGSRFEGLVPPVVSRPTFAIRLRPKRIFTFAEYKAAGILTRKDDPRNRPRVRKDFAAELCGLDHDEVLARAIAARKNILLAGATGSGKTTLLNACMDCLADLTPNDRVVILEDTIELQCPVPNCVMLHATGNISMLDCVRASMRLRPTRIIVGEARDAAAHELIKAWNTGHPGGFLTVHANNALLALDRLERLVAEATSAPSRELIAEAVGLVVFIDEEAELAAGRKVREILLVTGYTNGEYRYEYV
jgi:type IV secretion system protein TrbB